MENIILTILVIVIAIITWLIASLIDDVKELKAYNKLYKNIIKEQKEELEKNEFIRKNIEKRG